MSQAELESARLRIVVLGLALTSSWGNGHATTYRALLRALSALGHDVLFLERDLPWYAENRDLPRPDFLSVALYGTLDELERNHTHAVRQADLVIVGSYVPDGTAIGDWVARTAQGVVAFYDIDTPVTLALLAEGDERYLSRALIPRYDLYLSFTGGPVLEQLERRFGSPRARALYCSVDPDVYFPEPRDPVWDLGYMGTYSADRQRTLERLLLEPARCHRAGRFAVVGAQYPDGICWPANTERIAHLAPDRHRAFYNQQRFTLNVTRARMRELGHSPSVRLFEAAACGTPIISDSWAGLEDLFKVGEDILIAESAGDTLAHLRDVSPEQRTRIGQRARARVLQCHTASHRARQLLDYVQEARG
jgi:spore maturation protein CgeB